MMMGKPGRPGMALTGPVLPADAAPAVRSKITNTKAARIASHPDMSAILFEGESPRVKANRQSRSKPNAQGLHASSIAGDGYERINAVLTAVRKRRFRRWSSDQSRS